MGTGEPLVQLKSESKSLRARRTDDGPILRARPNQPPARCSPPQRLSREPDLQHHGQIELDCWPKEDESHVKLSHPATSACNRLALLSPPQISQTAAYLHPLNRLKNSTGISELKELPSEATRLSLLLDGEVVLRVSDGGSSQPSLNASRVGELTPSWGSPSVVGQC
ncbi:T-complex protein 1 subunit zeta-2 isoform 6-T9 [Megaptera novaeangliae]